MCTDTQQKLTKKSNKANRTLRGALLMSKWPREQLGVLVLVLRKGPGLDLSFLSLSLSYFFFFLLFGLMGVSSLLDLFMCLALISLFVQDYHWVWALVNYHVVANRLTIYFFLSPKLLHIKTFLASLSGMIPLSTRHLLEKRGHTWQVYLCLRFFLKSQLWSEEKGRI